MATWVYLASRARANEADTLRFAESENVIVRPARKTNGCLTPNAGRLAPGDTVLLAYRDGRPFVARVKGCVAAVARPVSGTCVIEAISGPFARELIAAGYEALEGGKVEILHLEDVAPVAVTLHGAYGGNNAIHELDAIDERSASAPAGSAIAPPPSEPAGTEAPYEEPCAPPVTVPGRATRIFDAYAMVDWSSSSEPCLRENSIWIGCGEWNGDVLRETWENPSTRQSALASLRATLGRWVREGKRCLLGLDFGFGYPCGFAAALGLTAPAWRATLSHFRDHVCDDPRNVHNRDAFAAACNAKITTGPGPFWGCHNGAAGPNLTTRRVGVFTFPHRTLAEFRLAERRAAGRATVQSVWKLNQGVSVGGQTVLGIKYLAELRDRSAPELASAIRLWPFETRWELGTARVVVAEIFPSIVPLDTGLKGVPDFVQVLSCVRHAAKEDAAGTLAGRFARPAGLTQADATTALEEEGWILFV